jgi:hypothetical protein
MHAVFAALEATVDRSVMLAHSQSLASYIASTPSSPAPVPIAKSLGALVRADTSNTSTNNLRGDAASPVAPDQTAVPRVSATNEHTYRGARVSPYAQPWKRIARSEFLGALVFVAAIRLPLAAPFDALRHGAGRMSQSQPPTKQRIFLLICYFHNIQNIF